jgi:hypothetical protein
VGIDDAYFGGELQKRVGQIVEFPRFREQVVTAEGGEDVLLHLGSFASGLHDLQVREIFCFLDTDEHGGPPLYPLRE